MGLFPVSFYTGNLDRLAGNLLWPLSIYCSLIASHLESTAQLASFFPFSLFWPCYGFLFHLDLKATWTPFCVFFFKKITINQWFLGNNPKCHAMENGKTLKTFSFLERNLPKLAILLYRELGVHFILWISCSDSLYII